MNVPHVEYTYTSIPCKRIRHTAPQVVRKPQIPPDASPIPSSSAGPIHTAEILPQASVVEGETYDDRLCGTHVDALSSFCP